jgi:hypothetical protein
MGVQRVTVRRPSESTSNIFHKSKLHIGTCYEISVSHVWRGSNEIMMPLWKFQKGKEKLRKGAFSRSILI